MQGERPTVAALTARLRRLHGHRTNSRLEAQAGVFSVVSMQPSRAATTAEMIKEAIVASRLRSAERLPTGRQLMARFAVSRTVVHEAMAALR